MISDMNVLSQEDESGVIIQGGLERKKIGA